MAFAFHLSSFVFSQLLEQEELKREGVLSERDTALAEVTRPGGASDFDLLRRLPIDLLGNPLHNVKRTDSRKELVAFKKII